MNKKTKRAVPLKFEKAIQGRKFDEIYSQTVNVLNTKGGMGKVHRETPYDLDNKDDLIEAIEKTFCELSDVHHYCLEVGKIVENYDETLELYEPKQWMHGSNGSPHGVVRTALNESSSALDSLIYIKREEFIYLIEKALNFPKNNMSEFIFEKKEEIEDIENFLEMIKESLWEVDDYYSYDTSGQRKQLKEFMKDNLSSFLD